MNQREEKCYIEGQRSAMRYTIMDMLHRYRGDGGKEFKGLSELTEARNYVRGLFEQIGCIDDYDPELHLADCLNQLGKCLNELTFKKRKP